MSRRKKLLIFGGGAVAVAALIALNAAGRRDRGESVRIAAVERRNLVATVTASGQIEPQRSVDISADITGRIIQILVQEGDFVKRGDLVLRIEPSQYEAQVAQARALLSSAEASALQSRANRDQAKRAWDRAQELRRQSPNLVSDEQLEQSQTSFEVAEAVYTSAQYQVAQSRAALQNAQELLAKTVLRAPMDGEVTRLAKEEGEVAVPGTFSPETGLLMTISDLSVIQVAVRVDETDVVRLHLADSAEVTIDAFPDTTFTGRVTKISKSAVQGVAAQAGATNQAVDYDVEVTLDDPPSEIRPDLSATAKIITATRDSVLSIPIIALTVREHEAISTETAPQDTTKSKKETEGVFVAVAGIAQFRPVKVGIAGEEYFEVIDGLAEGDSIVAGPYQTIRDLRDDTRLRPVKETTTERP
ncbi:MAG: efflux RND transporter periplasmic adaptor subunit [Gemmatimonadota bacterium]|nr:efflux RND transporter periplasmic adaptor subunit [Gemmatimonadota bacterium]MDH3477324.1 efflux RND transporter periplasmic adaptor subunit [Gemmatimonadota bacterium]MDH3570334.1 efflux RND transporter periplasmic adaptor subunit [Gemmatimonadota bacterium]MDH5550453.1 efflux RND transporter periplasmic adaptor subunit [Gemmatimonadota bacterium]